jgi:hypothetical protein
VIREIEEEGSSMNEPGRKVCGHGRHGKRLLFRSMLTSLNGVNISFRNLERVVAASMSHRERVVDGQAM